MHSFLSSRVPSYQGTPPFMPVYATRTRLIGLYVPPLLLLRAPASAAIGVMLVLLAHAFLPHFICAE
jgi:hypothetical protein